MTDARSGLPWGAITVIGLTGVVMGVATALVGIPPALLVVCWVGFYVLWVVVVVRRSTPRPFATIVLGSVLSGVFTGGIQSAFLTQFRAANPWWATEMDPVADAELVKSLLVQGLGAGLVFGLVVGGVAWAIARRRTHAPAVA